MEEERYVSMTVIPSMSHPIARPALRKAKGRLRIPTPIMLDTRLKAEVPEEDSRLRPGEGGGTG